MEPYIQINKLTKAYDKKSAPALNKVSITVHSGEVYGFLGANGAGKSTTIRLLLNFIQPTSGSAKILSKDVVKDSVAVKQHVGYLAGDIALWPQVTGSELFAYLSKLQSNTHPEYLQELIKRFAAEPDKKIGSLSKGNRQKIGVIQALMHQPDVLILDEPTSGLDPLMQEVFYQCITEAKQRGAAVFVSSHNLAETQRMCDRIGIIKQGKLIHEQTLQGDTRLGGPVFRVVFKHHGDIDSAAKQPSIRILSKNGNTAVLQPSGSISATLTTLGRYDVAGFTTEQLNLEDDFMEYYGDGA